MTTFTAMIPALLAVIGLTVALTAHHPALTVAGALLSTGVFTTFAVVANLYGYEELAVLFAAAAALNVLLGVSATVDAHRTGGAR